jgi:PAS domain S-box-containing protein
MKDESKTKKQLIEELKIMRQHAEEFESSAFPIRKRREALLRKYEESGRSLFDYMLDGYAYCKMLFENEQPRDFIYLDVNPAFARLTELKNVVGQKVSQVIPGIRESNPELFEIYGRVALTGKPERFETYLPSLGIWFDVSVFSPAKEYFVAIFENITERKRAEKAIQESEARLRLALNAANAGTWEWDLRTNENYWSEELWRLYGIDPHSSEPSYEAWRQIVHPDDRAMAEQAVQEAASAGAELNAEWRVFDSDGSQRWLMSRGRPLRGADGQLEQYIGIVIDITERKRAEDMLRESEEALQEANEYLEQRIRERTMDLQNLTEQLASSRDDLRKLASELVLAEERERKRIATVLHDEIAQTLAVVRMRVDMLERLAFDDESRQTVKEAKELIVQSIQETRTLMNEVGNPLLSDMGIAAACESLADRLMERHPIVITCYIRDALKDLTSDLKVILFQVIRELLNNIIKHSRARNANVTIDTENGLIRAQVKDDGMGFDPQTLGAPTVEGGFGLFSIRERLMAFNGSLQIESSPGNGTVVTASLPASLQRSPGIRSEDSE